MDPLSGTCLHHLFERQVERTPDLTAVAYEGERLTYAALNGRANRLARHLRALGVGPEAVAGVFMERSLEMVVGLLAVFKAGGACLYLDPSEPRERLAYMLAETRSPLVLTQPPLRAEVPPGAARTLCVEAGAEATARYDDADLSVELSPDNLAYVLYTSGSTGRPKGVMCSHRISSSLIHEAANMRLDGSERHLYKYPVSHRELFLPLMTGGTAVVARPGGHQDVAYLLRLIREESVNVVSFVPSMIETLLGEPGLDACASVTRFGAGGESFSAALQAQLLARLDAEVYDNYSLAEAFYVLPRRCVLDDAGRVERLRLSTTMEFHLLDEGLQTVAAGEPGELYASGDGVARGYLNRPALTAERFLPDPFSATGGERLYRTGDLARLDPEGRLEFLGRSDHQVKIRGARVEMGEVEAALTPHPSVREAVVAVREDMPGEKRLVAYVVTAPGQTPTVSELRAFLLKRLAQYMIPTSFVMLGQLPRLPSGKVDRQALPAPPALRPPLETPYVEPRTRTERFVASVWQEVLSVEQVGTDDNFFELGGDSLSLVQVRQRLRDYSRSEISAADMFERPTVALLSALLEREDDDGGAGAAGLRRRGEKMREAAARRRAAARQAGTGDAA
jgi:amino acid adenylation domain-containing protein